MPFDRLIFDIFSDFHFDDRIELNARPDAKNVTSRKQLAAGNSGSRSIAEGFALQTMNIPTNYSTFVPIFFVI